MGIFKTITDVSNNKSNFKLWEEQQRLEQAQRQVLYNENDYSEAELEKARALGETIIDAIDVMDNHSESVAENVETATEPFVFLAPFLGTLTGGIIGFKAFINPAAKNIDKCKDDVLNSEAAKNLYSRFSKDDKNIKQIRDLINKKRVSKIENRELRIEAEKLIAKYNKKVAPYKAGIWTGVAIPFAGLLLSFIGSIVAATKMQVNSSKVARFQARKELEDPKCFVNYTPEQIEQAKMDMLADKTKTTRKSRRKEKSKLKQGFWGSLIGLIRDNKAYRNYKKTDDENAKLVTRELSSSEIIDAEKDKEIIQRTVRIINNEAEKNSMNMEVAADVLIGGTPFLGALVGGATSWILNKTKIIDKTIDKSIKSNSSKDTIDALEKYVESTKNKKLKGLTGLYKRITNFSIYADSSIKDLERNVAKPKPSEYFKRVIRIAMSHSKVRNWIFAISGAVVTGFAGLIIGLKLQKSAARAGRYNAKRDLEEDPRNFIGYTKAEYNQVGDVTPVKKESKFKEVVFFIPRVLKQYVAYNKYKKHEYKETQKLNKYLHKQEVSEQQMKEAKNLQRKVFNTFEKVDDNSQVYSESMEAAIDIAKPFVIFGGFLTASIPLVLSAVALVKSKNNPTKVIEKITGWMKKHSKVMNSKLTKKYLNGVARNVANKTAEETVSKRPIAFILKDVNLKDGNVLDNLRILMKNLKLSPDELRKQPDEVIDKSVNDLFNNLKKIEVINKKAYNQLGIKNMIESIEKLPAKEKINALDLIMNPKSINNLSQDSFDSIIKLCTNNMKLPKETIIILLNKVKNSLSQMSKNSKLKECLGDELLEILNKLDEKSIDLILNKTFDKKTLTTFINSFNKLLNKIDKLPKNLKESPEIKGLLKLKINIPEELGSLLEDYKTDPKKLKEIINFLKNNENKLSGKNVEISLNELLDLPKVTMRSLKTSLIESPSNYIKQLKEQALKTTPEKFDEIISKIPYLKNMPGMNKESLVRILSNLEAVIDNVPKKELKNIMDSILTEFNKNPDEFVAMMRNGKIKGLLLTPELQNTLTILGIAYPTLTIIITYAIESWLANMKLKAGRLGVMKSLEDLDDNRYYANIEA